MSGKKGDGESIVSKTQHTPPCGSESRASDRHTPTQFICSTNAVFSHYRFVMCLFIFHNIQCVLVVYLVRQTKPIHADRWLLVGNHERNIICFFLDPFASVLASRNLKRINHHVIGRWPQCDISFECMMLLFHAIPKGSSDMSEYASTN